ncbi:hypothetical protein CKW46_21090 [Mycobacterium liflandii]|nr:hypothetical protein CKW46_21090 [Mycobacterium liflandii]
MSFWVLVTDNNIRRSLRQHNAAGFDRFRATHGSPELHSNAAKTTAGVAPSIIGNQLPTTARPGDPSKDDGVDPPSAGRRATVASAPAGRSAQR